MSTTTRATRAQRRKVVSESEDIGKIEKNETDSHPVQAEETSVGNMEELVPGEMVEFTSATYPGDTDRDGQESHANTLGGEESRKSQEVSVVLGSEEKWDSKMEVTPIPEDTGRGGQEEGTTTVNQESPTDMPGQPREVILREQDSAMSQADQEVIHSQEKSEMVNTPVPDDTDRVGQEQGTSCTINQESAAGLPDKSRENTLEEDKPGSEMEITPTPEDTDRGGPEEGTSINQESPTDLPEKSCREEGSGKSGAEQVARKPDSEMEDAPVPEGGQEEDASSNIDQEPPEAPPEKPPMEELFNPKWVELIQLLPETSDPELELKEKDHQVGSTTHKFLYPVPMLPLADSVKQQWEEVNKDLTEDTSKVVPVRREDEKRFWTNNDDYRKYCESSTIDDDYCTQVTHEIRAFQSYKGSGIKKSFAIQDPLLHTCENSFKKCDESARMTIQASSHAVLMLNAVENILKDSSDRQSDALPLIEGIQEALECIANTSARVIARSTISRRTICMSQIHNTKPESIKKILKLPMDTKDLFHGEFKEMLEKKPQAKKRQLSESSHQSSEELGPIKRTKSNKKPNPRDRRHQSPMDNRPRNANAKKRWQPRFDHQRHTFDDRDHYGGSYGPPGQFSPYSHGRGPQHVPPYAHEQGSYPYDMYDYGQGDYNEGYNYAGGYGGFDQQGGSDFTGQKQFGNVIEQEGMNQNAQERIRERLNQKGHS
ncbi:uncharacterized protein [Asterias amurensis]|uniref:uncharacterized protein n=1 Tax=Asterias amurensis TaxID=7602 RepID=UPI003AB1876A